jgi:hypothetical protein
MASHLTGRRIGGREQQLLNAIEDLAGVANRRTGMSVLR